MTPRKHRLFTLALALLLLCSGCSAFEEDPGTETPSPVPSQSLAQPEESAPPGTAEPPADDTQEVEAIRTSFRGQITEYRQEARPDLSVNRNSFDEVAIRTVCDLDSAHPWAREYISNLLTEGLITVRSDDVMDVSAGSVMFYPQRNITVEEYLRLILLVTFGSDEITIDTANGFWWEPYSEIPKPLKEVFGSAMSWDKDTLYREITREEMAYLTVRCIQTYTDRIGYLPEDSTPDYYPDWADIRTDYRPHADYLYRQGIMVGHDGLFLPGDKSTREEAAKIIWLTYAHLQRAT